MAEGSLIDDAKTIGFHRKLTLYSSGGPFIDAYVLSIIGVALTQAEAPLGLGSVLARSLDLRLGPRRGGGLSGGLRDARLG